MQEMWLQLAFKHVRGKVSVQPVEGGRAALLLPIRIPPKIFRLPLSQPTVGKSPASNTSMRFNCKPSCTPHMPWCNAEASRLAAAAGLLASASSSEDASSSPFDLSDWDSPLPEDSTIQAASGASSDPLLYPFFLSTLPDWSVL